MLKQSPKRSQRCRGFKVKNVVHTCLMIVICVWLLYQMNNHRKSHEEEEGEDIAGAGVGIVKLGRRDLRSKHDLIVTAEKEERDLEEGEEDEEEDEEEEGRGGGDDEIDGLDQDIADDDDEEEEEAVDFEDLISSEMDNDEVDHDGLGDFRNSIDEDEDENRNEEQSIREFRVVSRAKRFDSNSSALIKTNPGFNATSYYSAEAVLSGESRSMGLKMLTRKENSDGLDDYDDDIEEFVGDSSDF